MIPKIFYKRFITKVIILIFCFNISLLGQLLSFETDKINVIYTSDAHYFLIPHLASSFEKSSAFHHKFFGFESKEKISILFHDFGDFGYGGASNLPHNMLIIGIEPFDYTFDVMPSNERLSWLLNHELTHITLIDRPNKKDNFFRSLFFGKTSANSAQPLTMLYSYLTAPRRYSPRWYHEGIAVFMETWMSGGTGRVLGGYDEMVFRTMVKENSYFYNAVGLEAEGTTVDFQVGMNSYLYGTRIISYLAYKYGIEKLKDWYLRDDNSNTYFASQFEKVYGNTIKDEWDNWIKFEKEFQNSNLEKINKYKITELKAILDKPIGSVSKLCFDKDSKKIIAGINFPGQLAKIASIDMVTGEVNKICDMSSPAMYYVTSIAYDDSSKNIFYTTGNSQDWRSINMINAITKENRVLLEECRIGDLAFNSNDKSLWGMQHNSAYSYLVKIDYPYNYIEYIYKLPYGKDLFDLNISKDGKYLVGTMSELSGQKSLVRLNISKAEKGIVEFENLFEYPQSDLSNFAFSDDSKYLYGSSYYTGVSNIFQFDLETKKMDILTNCETGLFRPIQYGPDSLIALKYTAKGFIPVKFKKQILDDVDAISYLGQNIIEKYSELEKYFVGSPSTVDVDTIKRYDGEYNSFSNLKLNSVYPIVEGYKLFPSYGIKMDFFDDLLLISLGLKVSYSPNTLIPEKQRLHSELNFKYWDWEFGASYNYANFYDLFGPTKVSRAGYKLSLQYNKALIFKTPYRFEYILKGQYYGDLEKLPDYQNIDASFDNLISFSGNIKYSYLRKSLGANDYEEGYIASLDLANSIIDKRNYLFGKFNLDFGLLTPLDHLSIWLRNSVGNSFNKISNNTFSYFYFGGFGNNWVDYREVRRFREFYSFPGSKLNEISGFNYIRSLIEMDFPAIRFGEFGFLSLYATYLRFAAFGGILSTNFDDYKNRNNYFCTGIQFDLELVMFSLLKSTLSFGYGFTFKKNENPKNEFMFSLKIL